MSDDFANGGLPQTQLSQDDILNLAREVIAREASRDLLRQNNPNIQRPGATLDLGHQRIVQLPDEIIDIIKDEIERLAISHNDVVSFPARLAECRRLRYLNARFNRFSEFPRPVLQLASLEILDLSRNRLRYLPDEISEMTALKVFAVQRNKIERLPTTLGDMHRLRVLKVDENPLIFPPPEVWREDEETTSLAGEKAMLHITARIKKYLQKHANSSAGRTKPSQDRDADDDNFDPAETPRPVRPAGTRFPVRPSMSGIDSSSQPATSPDNENRTPPPIPNRSHDRVKSLQPNLSRKGSLLSPPDSVIVDPSDPNGINLRSKRHGMVTPRGLENSALSPVALQEAFGTFGIADHSRTGSSVSNVSITTNNILDTSKLVYNTATELSRKLNSMRPMLEWQNQNSLKAQVEADLRIASNRIDVLAKTLRRAQKETGNSTIQISQRPSYLLRPVVEVLISISAFTRCLGQCAAAYTRSSNGDAYKTTFWEVQKDTWDLYIANQKMSEAIKSANHSRQASTSSHFKQLSFDRPNIAAAFGHYRNAPSRNGFSSSPNSNSQVHSSHQSQSSTTSNLFSPPIHSTPIITSDGMILEPQDEENDNLWYSFYQSLKTLCEKAAEGLPKIQRHYYEQRQRIIRMYDQDHDAVRQLGSLVSRSNNLVDVANRLSAKLESVRPGDKAIRQSLEFWQLCRTIIMEWTGYVDKTRLLSPVLLRIHSEIKPVMKNIHVAVKDSSTRLSQSPWAHYLNQSNYADSFPSTNSRTHTSSNSQSNNGSGPSSTGLNPPPTPSLSSVPSTPLSAALGPAAIATLPSNSTRLPQGRSGMNVFERAEKLAAGFAPRQPEMLYSRKG